MEHGNLLLEKRYMRARGSNPMRGFTGGRPVEKPKYSPGGCRRRPQMRKV